MKNIRSVLIVRVGAMGDVLHAMPAVAALRRAHPECRIGWVVEPRWLPLLQADSGSLRPNARGATMPLIDRAYLAATKDWKRSPFSRTTLGDIISLRRELRAEAYDLCVDMQGSIRSAVIGRMAGAQVFAGPAAPRERQAAWLYQEKIAQRALHVVEQGCELLNEATGELLQPERIELPLDASAEASCGANLARLNPNGRRLVMIVPRAGWGAKQWPVERFGAVAAQLEAKGYRVLINAVSANDALAKAVVDASGGNAGIAVSSVAELIELTRRLALVIAGDTGPLHLAAVLERPVVALFGPTDPARNGPYCTRSRVLRHGGERRNHRRLANPEAGLMEIKVEETVEAALELLESREDAGRDKVVE